MDASLPIRRIAEGPGLDLFGSKLDVELAMEGTLELYLES